MNSRKQSNLFLLVFVWLIFLMPNSSHAQSTIISTPNFPDIFATLQSGSDFIAVASILFASILLLSKATADLLSVLPLLLVARPKNFWGIVFNPATKEPVRNIAVCLYKSSNDIFFLVKKCKTDSSGKYGFEVDSGEYKMDIKNSGFIFPSRYKGGEDEPTEVYTGDKFFITEQDKYPEINIPVDPLFSTSTSFGSKLNYYGKRVGLPLLLLGTFFGLYSLYYFPSKFRLILISIYSIAWLVVALDVLGRVKGIKVVSSENGVPVDRAIVDFYGPDKQKVLSLSTDDSGRVFPHIAPGEYLIRVHRPYQNSVEKRILLEKSSPFSQIVIRA